MLFSTLALALAFPQITVDEALLTDLNALPGAFDFGSRPTSFSSDGQLVYFAARDDAGNELWVSDGTPAGTQRIDEPWPGPVGSLTFLNPTRPAVTFLPGGGGAGVFAADSSAAGRELWRVDGAAGTIELLGDLAPGIVDSGPASFVEHQGELFFLADDGTNGRELWKTDGTPGGTQLAADLEPGPGSLWNFSDQISGARLASTGSTLVVARSVFGQLDLFTSSGGPGAATSLITIPTLNVERPFTPGRFGAVNGRLLFGVTENEPGSKGVWATDGTSGGTAQLLPDEELDWVVVDGARAFFATSNGTVGSLWVSDGTLAGTTQLMGSGFAYRNPAPQQGAIFNGELYLSAWAQGAPLGNAGTELVATDGTVAGTRLVVDLSSGASSAAPRYLVEWSGELYFVASVVGGLRMYRTDGTEAGTVQVDDPSGGPLGLTPSAFGPDYPAEIVTPFHPSASALVYPRTTSSVAGGNVEPWGATAGGNALLLDIAGPVTADSEPRELTQVGDLLYFSAAPVSTFARKLFVYDTSTGAGPIELDVPNAANDLDPRSLTAWKGGLAFAGHSEGVFERSSVWWTDGTSFVQLNAEPYPFLPGALTAAGDQLFFIGGFVDQPTNLLVSDGTAGSAQPVPAAGVAATTDWFEMVHLGDGRVIGSGSSDAAPTDFELLVSDGTPAGTFRIVILPGPSGSLPQNFAVSDGVAYFQANDGVHGIELWRSDGTAGGTQLVADVTPGNGFSRVWATTPWNGGVVYTYQSGNDHAVMVSDGTPAGTLALVSNQGSSSGPYIPSGDRLFFPWGLPEYTELWVSDGTPSGTGPVPGTGVGALQLEQFARPVAFGSDSVAFGANEGFGVEWYSTDGTLAGTQRLTDWFGSAIVANYQFAEPLRVGDALYVVADDLTYGEELYALPLGIAGAGAVDVLGVGCGTSAGTLAALDPPTLGSTFRLRMEAGPSAPAGFLLDLDLVSTAGDPCLPLLPNPLTLTTALADPTGLVELSLALPNDPALLGRNVFVGAFSVGLGEPFLGLASLSNALGIVFGD